MAVPGFGYYIAGTSSSGVSANFDAYLLFTDEAGGLVWENHTDNGAWERVNDAVLLADTSVFVVGQTDSTDNGNQDLLLIRYAKDGSVMWQQQWGTAGDDIAYAVIPSSDTTVLIGGTYYVTDSLKNKAFLAEVHHDGSLIWKKYYGNQGEYQFNDLHKSATLIKAIGQRVKTGYSDHDIYNMTAYPDGTFIGSEEFYVPDDTRYVAMAQYTASGSGQFFIAAQSINPNTPTYPEGEDCYISRYSSGLYWDGYGVSYSGVGQDQANEMIPTSDGYAVAVGFHTTYGTGGNSVFVVKIGDDSYFPPASSSPVVISIVTVAELVELKDLRVYPNPVSDNLFIEVAGKTFGYTLLDASGKQLLHGRTWETQELDLSAQPQGVYFLTIVHESGERAVVKVIR
jgi:hypothetical protein